MVRILPGGGSKPAEATLAVAEVLGLFYPNSRVVDHLGSSSHLLLVNLAWR